MRIVAGFVAAASSVAAPSAGAATANAPAAQRVCKPRVEWTGLGPTLAQARHRTLDGWAAAVAASHGEAYADWRNAGVARVSCTLTLDGHRCRAAASPCSSTSRARESVRR